MLTLALGLAVASGAAAIFALAQDWLDLIPSGFNIDATVLGSLTTVNDETIAVALAAGSPACWRSRLAPAPASGWRSR